MSTRLAAAKKGEFYPTPRAVLPLLANLARAPEGGTLLDPCAGDGVAAATLAEAWGLRAFGNELSAARAAEARTRLEAVTVGSYDTLVNEHAADGVSCLLLNPPYGDTPAGATTRRRETAALAATIGHLAPGGLCICLVPLRVAVSDEFLSQFARACVPAGLARFPDPEFGAFQQVALWGTRRATAPTGVGATDVLDVLRSLHIPWRAKDDPTGAALPVLGVWPFPQVSLPAAASAPVFVNSGIDVAALATQVALAGATTDVRFHALVSGTTSNGERLQAQFTPLLPLKRGHAAELLAAGFLDGAEVTYGGRLCLVRGTSRTKVTEQRDVDAERALTRVTAREHPVAVLTFVDAETGALTVLDAERDRDAYEAFIVGAADALIRLVQERYPAYYQPDAPVFDARVEGVLTRCRAPQRLFDLPDTPLPIQADAARAVAAAVRDGKRAVVISGEMGTGKTTVGALIWAVTSCTAMTTGTARAVVVAPGHLVKKWRREVTTVLREWDVEAIIAKTVADVDRAFHATRPSVVILSQETAKFGMKWAPVGQCLMRPSVRESLHAGEVVAERVMQPVVRCPDCGAVQTDGDEVPLGWTTDDRTGERVPAYGAKRRTCPSCRAALWQVVPYASGRKGRRGLPSRASRPLTDGPAFGGGKVALASYIATRYRGTFTLLADEAHELHAADSDRGVAFGRLSAASQLAVGLTGTLYGGRASSLFYLAYRFFREFRALFRLSDCDRFIQQYGLIEEVRYEHQGHGAGATTSTYGYTRLPAARRREIPGARPELVALLLPHTLFIDLEDLGVALPAYNEYRLSAPLPEVARPSLARLEHFKKAAVRAMRQGDHSGLSKWMQAALGWPYAMDREDALRMSDGTMCELSGLHVPPAGFPLDAKLVAFACAERDAGRRVLVYLQQMNRRDPSMRLESLLREAGLRVATLRSGTVKREDREEWVSAKLEEGLDVLLTQPSLVQTGIDLLGLPSLVFFQPDMSTYRARQASRRSWRLGQDRPVNVLFATYDGTLAAQSLGLVARKLRAADRVDGRLVEGLAASAADDQGDLLDAIMRQVLTGRAGEGGGGFEEYPLPQDQDLSPAAA
ncbi:MAG: hypothetical protein H3C62_01275 [Gemmatimonadaceae bacterium]|nr:hypothetical protein [Gemmatimonadaceae bacterium]